MVVYAGSVRDISLDGLDLTGLEIRDQTAWVADCFYERIMLVDLSNGVTSQTIDAPGIDGDVTVHQDGLAYVAGGEIHLLDPRSGEVTDRSTPRPGHRITGMYGAAGRLYLAYSDLGVLDVRDGDNPAHVEDCYSIDSPAYGLTVVGDSVVAVCNPEIGSVRLHNPQGDSASRLEVSIYGRPTAIGWDGKLMWYVDAATLELRALQLPAQPVSGILLSRGVR